VTKSRKGPQPEKRKRLCVFQDEFREDIRWWVEQDRRVAMRLLDLVEAVLALEEEWSIEIPEDEMESVKTVGQAIDLVATKLGVD